VKCWVLSDAGAYDEEKTSRAVLFDPKLDVKF